MTYTIYNLQLRGVYFSIVFNCLQNYTLVIKVTWLQKEENVAVVRLFRRN